MFIVDRHKNMNRNEIYFNIYFNLRSTTFDIRIMQWFWRFSIWIRISDESHEYSNLSRLSNDNGLKHIIYLQIEIENIFNNQKKQFDTNLR